MSHARDHACELCEAARLTEWFYEDDECWIAECDACAVPMVVWRVHDPLPPREVEPGISPQLQEIVLRALKRDPRDRYATAREFAADLEHPQNVVVGKRVLQEQREPLSKQILFYSGLAAIPAIIFGLLLYVAQHP